MPRTPAAKPAKSFAGELAAFVSTSAAPAKAEARPDGEQTKKIAGHPYALIKNGADKGKFVNQLAGQSRQGSVFEMVERDERVFHVYGAGKDKVVVEIKAQNKDDSASPPASGGARSTT